MWNLLSNKVVLTVAGILLAMALCFGGGWASHKHYVGYQQNIERTVKDAVDAGIANMQRDAAKNLLQVQHKIDGLTPGNTVERNTITLQPIYSNVCVDESGVDHTKKYQKKLSELREVRK